jgi:hypothetical protein
MEPPGPAAHPLASVLARAARGVFPVADGTLEVVPAPIPLRAAVVAFTAHSLVATDLPAERVRAHLPAEDLLGAPMSPAFLAWLAQELDATPGVLDVVLVHVGASMPSVELTPQLDAHAHLARVARALGQRRQVQVYAEPQQRGLVILGRGLADRWELSIELAPDAQNHGLGRAMISAGRALVAPDEPVFAQVSPGNARSLRAFLAAGFRPIGSEILFH